MAYRVNEFSETFKPEGGFVDLEALEKLRSQSFDKFNDCYVDERGAFVRVRSLRKKFDISKLGILGACTDAMLVWERHANGNRALYHTRAGDPTECGFAAE